MARLPHASGLAWLLCAASAGCGSALWSAQQAAPGQQAAGQAKASAAASAGADANKLPAERGDVVDRLVAIVNNDIVLESDIEEEERFSKLYPYRTSSGETPREQALKRLIDRDLILQQIRQPQPEVDKAAVDKEEADLRRDLPACAHADCQTEAGWSRFLAGTGFTREELRARLRLRTEVLRFVEQRFRNGIRISDKQIEDFYTGTMLPQYRKEHATPPTLEVLSSRIEELLLQEEVSKLLDGWLKALRESGNVRMVKPGEELP